MDVGTLTNEIAALASVITVGVSALFALRQLRSAQSANHTLVAIELLTRDRMSDAFLDSQRFVLSDLAAAHPTAVPVSELPPEAAKHVSRLALYYNGLGQMLAFKVVDPALLIGTGGFRARQAWAILEPYIRAERALRGESYLSHFEHLVVVATDNPWPVAVRKLGLRRLPGPAGSGPTAGPGEPPHPGPAAR